MPALQRYLQETSEADQLQPQLSTDDVRTYVNNSYDNDDNDDDDCHINDTHYDDGLRSAYCLSPPC